MEPNTAAFAHVTGAELVDPSKSQIIAQTERLQKLAEALGHAVSTLEDRAGMLLRPVDGKPMGEPIAPAGMSAHALALFQTAGGIEASLTAIQELTARIDH